MYNYILNPMFKLLIAIVISSSSLFFLPQDSHAFEVPRLRNAVNDNAGLLSRREQRSLEVLLRNFQQSGGGQVAILTVKDLQGESIEQASIQITDQWKLGNEGKDDGLLILVAKAERKVRIEVGQGLEGSLPDAYAKKIIAEIITPTFKQGEFAKGLYLGFLQIAKYTHPEINLTSQGSSSSWKRKSRRKKRGLGDWVVMALFFIFFIFGGRSSRRGMLLGALLGGSFGRGGGGYSSGGGFGGFSGGFSGGGGGFSGGGASGDW